ncbi:putative immunoglobulin-blocking virulence protein [Mycoplasmopsis iners]|uniref:putative immunoglobulin-blocking virulence protein n=1 Tax=Mycoplasmopsis iners TaxID=76630 RepID=UPI000495007F|nr:putative immunoglobulin-blocking virulence protein [Mycoplasmopsis iners]
MIKAKKIKLIINLSAISTVALASALIAKFVSSENAEKAKNINPLIQNRGSKSILTSEDVKTNDKFASNKDDSLELKEKKITPIEAEQPKEKPKEEPKVEAEKPPVEENQPKEPNVEPELPKEPEPAPVEPAPSNPVEPEPDPQPVTPPAEPEIPENPEKESEKDTSTTIVDNNNNDNEEPIYTDVNPVAPPDDNEKEDNEPIRIDEPVVVAPEPKREDEPEKPKEKDPSELEAVAIAGRVDLSTIKDLDFAKLKELEPSKIEEKAKKEIKDSLAKARAVAAKMPSHWSAEDRKILHNAFKKLREFNPYTAGASYDEVGWDKYLDLVENTGETTEEKWKRLGMSATWGNDNRYNYPLLFKMMLENYERQADEMFAKGMVPNINWMDTGNVWSHADLSKNVVRNKMIADNKRRVFSNDTEWKRNTGEIRNLNYNGYSKTDVSNDFKKFGFTNKDGIEVYKYTPNKDNKYALDNNPGNKFIAVLDASNRSGYTKFLDFVKKASAQSRNKLDGIVIKNMGLGDKYQDFKHILSQLPSNIKKLTLFFEAKDTSSLIGLKDKQIDELELYTSNETISHEWAINPNALRGVKYISFDYSHSATSTNKDMPGSIVFNTLKFEPTDTVDIINQGLDMAFDTRSGERVFQGQFGDGSWPTFLDFSNNPSIRSLQGMRFHDRVFKKLTLYNRNNIFTVDGKTISDQQWSALLIKGPERPKLEFVSPVTVDTLYISGNAVDLKDNYNVQFYALLEAGKYVFNTVYVDNQKMADTLNRTQAFTTFGKTAVVKPANFNPDGDLNANDISFD